MSDLAASGARGGIASTGAQGINLVLRIAGVVVLARLVDPHDFGVAGIAAAFAAFGTLVAYAGIPIAATRLAGITRAHESALAVWSVSIGVALAAILLTMAPIAASAYHQAGVGTSMAVFAVLPILAGLEAVPRARLLRELRFGALAKLSVVGTAVGLAVAITLAFEGLQLVAVLAQVVVPALVQSIGSVSLSGWSPVRPSFDTDVKKILSVGRHIAINNILQSLGRVSLAPIAGTALPAAAVGQFDRAQQLSLTPLQMLVDQLQGVAVPILNRARETVGRFEDYSFRAFDVVASSGVPVLFAAAGVASPIVELLLGSEWRTVGELLGALLIAAAARLAIQPLHWSLLSLGKARTVARFGAAVQPLVIVAAIGGLHWGLEGLVWAFAAAWWIGVAAMIQIASSSAGLSSRRLFASLSKSIVGFALPAYTIGLLAQALLDDPLHQLATGAAAIAVTFAALLTLSPWGRDVARLVRRVARVARR